MKRKAVILVSVSILGLIAIALVIWKTRPDYSSLKYYEKKGYSISQPMTVEDIETTSLKEMAESPWAPQIPFGYLNEGWEELKKNIQPGDEILFIRSPQETWDQLCGREGYIIAREGTIIYWITTTVN